MADKGPEALTGPVLLKNAYDTYLLPDQSAVRDMIQGIAMRLPDNLQPQTGTSRVELLDPGMWYPDRLVQHDSPALVFPGRGFQRDAWRTDQTLAVPPVISCHLLDAFLEAGKGS